MRVEKTEKGLVKMWTDFVPVDEGSLRQLSECADMPFVYKHIAAMPDVHYGYGATIGSVIPTKSAVIPAAVGVDIGCGMIAVKTSLTATDLPDELATMRSAIESVIPVGFAQHQENKIPEKGLLHFNQMKARLESVLSKHPKIEYKGNGLTKAAVQIGTLGGGNHFVEMCIDTRGSVWVMLHSGSRGIGNQIGTYFINKAKELMEQYFIDLHSKDLAYLPENTQLFDDYIEAMEWAQEYAMFNREVMLDQTLKAMRDHLPEFTLTDSAINCHHNYTQKENHFGENVWVTRKGAVNARKGVLGIIPGSMGAKSFIVEGKGNEESFCSCSHGAGRVMSRTEAKKRVNIAQHIDDTKGVECRKDEGVLDETPSAYKNIDDVMRSQEDLVEVKYQLKQVLCVKG